MEVFVQTIYRHKLLALLQEISGRLLISRKRTIEYCVEAIRKESHGTVVGI